MAGPGREASRRAWAVAVPAPPRWRASARAAGGWRDLPAETLSTLACAGSTVVVRGWCALIGWPALGTWLCATGWTPIAWSWIAPVLNGPLAGRHRPRWPWHLAPPVCSMPWWSYLLTPPSPPPHPCIAAARGDARLRAQGALPQPRGHAAVHAELSIVNELLLERHAAARVRQAGLPPAHFLQTARFSTF